MSGLYKIGSVLYHATFFLVISLVCSLAEPSETSFSRIPPEALRPKIHKFSDGTPEQHPLVVSASVIAAYYINLSAAVKSMTIRGLVYIQLDDGKCIAVTAVAGVGSVGFESSDVPVIKCRQQRPKPLSHMTMTSRRDSFSFETASYLNDFEVWRDTESGDSAVFARSISGRPVHLLDLAMDVTSVDDLPGLEGGASVLTLVGFINGHPVIVEVSTLPPSLSDYPHVD